VVGEVYVSAELIGIITATVALGTVMLTLARGMRQDSRMEFGVLREEIGVLRGEMRGGQDTLRKEMKAGLESLRAEMKNESRP
jgi:hypothetical protein